MGKELNVRKIKISVIEEILQDLFVAANKITYSCIA